MGEEKKIEPDKADMCSIFAQAAGEMLLEKCGHERALDEMAKLYGIEDENPPLSAKCEMVLERGLTEDVCRDFREIRRYIMCAAWGELEEGDVLFGDAISRAWAEAKKRCAELGAEI